MNIKVIPTTYKGYKFRSRLEARWAVFFDALDWKWEYEFEGFDLPSGYYLPDFYFPDFKYFAECKPGEFSKNEFSKCCELSTIHPVILLDGVPDFKTYKYLYQGVEQTDCVFEKKGSKYYPLFYTYDYNEEFFEETTNAVIEARAARFEFGQP